GSSWYSKVVSIANYWYSRVVSIASSWWGNIVSIASSWYSNIVSIASSWYSRIESIANSWWDKIVAIAVSWWDKLVYLCETAWNKIQTFLDVWGSMIEYMANKVPERVTYIFEEKWPDLFDLLTNLKDKIRKTISEIFHEFIFALANGLVEYVKDKWGDEKL
ncbi:unnamed protein product, partial [marine sediment metagenome]